MTDPQSLTPDPGSRRLLLHGTADEDVPVSQSEAYLAHLQANGVDADLTLIPGDTHYEILDPTSHVSAIRREALTRALLP